LKYTSRDTSNATEMNTQAKLQPKLWLALAVISWLVGTGLGHILFY